MFDSCGAGGERERATGVLVSLCIGGGFRLSNHTDEVHRDLAIDGCLRERIGVAVVDDPQVAVPLAWWVPTGRVVEADDRTLVMPVYGAASQADLQAAIYSCGLLRSSDEGKTWGDAGGIEGGGPT